MPNYTVSDAKKHNKDLADSKAQQWAKVANSVHRHGVCEEEENRDALAVQVANGVITRSAGELATVIFGLDHTDLRADILEGLYHQHCPGLFENEVVEHRVLEDGTELSFLDSASYLIAVEETSMLPAAGDELEDAHPGVVLAENDNGQHIAVFRAIQGRNTLKGENGISKNRNFYSGEVAEGLAPLLSARRKMYLNHKGPEKMGRPVEDLAGIITEAWAKDGASFVKTDVLTENTSTGFIWEIMKKYPEEIGVSINAFVRGRRAVIDKLSVFAVEGWNFLNSLDFVGDQSAGGTLQRTESQEEPGETEMPSQGNITEAFKKSLSAELEKSKKHAALDSIGWLVTGLIRSAAFDRETDEEGRRKNVKTIIKEFGIEIEKLDPVSLFKEFVDRAHSAFEETKSLSEGVERLEVVIDLLTMQPDLAQEGWSPAALVEADGTDAFTEVFLNHVQFSAAESEDRTKLPASAFLVVGDPEVTETWHWPYKTSSGAVRKGALRAIESVLDTVSDTHGLFIPTTAKLRTERLLKAAGSDRAVESISPPSQEVHIVDPEALKILTWEQLVMACPAAVAKVEEHNTALAEVTREKEAAETAVQEAETAKQTAEQKALESERELDELKLKEAVQEQENLVDRLIEASEILDSQDENHISKTFKDDLLRLAKEGEEVVQSAIKDREGLVSSIRESSGSGVAGNGQRRQPVVPVEEANGSGQGPFTDGVVESVDKNALVKNLTSSR